LRPSNADDERNLHLIQTKLEFAKQSQNIEEPTHHRNGSRAVGNQSADSHVSGYSGDMFKDTDGDVDVEEDVRTEDVRQTSTARALAAPRLNAVESRTFFTCCYDLAVVVIIGIVYRCLSASDGDVARPSRLALLDNSKAFAMLLVIFQHILLYNYGLNPSTFMACSDSRLYNYAYTISECLCMPLFSFISGVLSQSPPTVERLRKFFSFLVVPAILWHYTAAIFTGPIGGLAEAGLLNSLSLLMHNMKTTFIDRELVVVVIPWYVSGLIGWRVIAFVCSALFRRSIGGLLMLSMSLAGGYMTFSGLGLSLVSDAYIIPINKGTYIIGFLSYFALGYVFPFEWAIASVGEPSLATRLGVGLLLPAAILTLALSLGGDQQCFLRTSDAHMDYMNEPGGCTRQWADWEYPLLWTHRLAKVFFDSSLVLPLLFYGLPRHEKWYTYVGTYTLYAYLFHEVNMDLVDRTLSFLFPYSLEDRLLYSGEMIVTFMLAITYLLFFTSWPWRCLFSWLVEPTWADYITKTVIDRTVGTSKELGGRHQAQVVRGVA